MKNTSKNLLSFATFLCIPLTVLVINRQANHCPPTKTPHRLVQYNYTKPLYKKGKITLALSTAGYTVVGAGTTAANGNYVPVTGAGSTYNGATQYTNGTYWLAYNSSWGIQGAISSNGVPVYYATGTASATNIPSTGWTTGNGSAPIPTVIATVVVTGAGTAAANGNYVPVTGAGATYNGAVQYTNGTEFLTFQSSVPAWYIQVTASVNIIPLYSNGIGATVTNIPLTGWTVAQGGTPAPTVNAFTNNPPTAATVPTLGATTTGVSTLPVNTQALTANATSEVVNIYTNSAGTTPISGSPFAVPTPGTAVNVTLVSGTQYYISIGMVGTSGTTNGPLLAELFDVIGPVIVSAVIQPSGNVLVVTHTEYSQPLQANGSLHSLTGLTGGPDTLASPTYGGTTITYNLSRTVISTETGGLLNAPAGAFKDSAVPTNNSSPVVTNLAVVNNSTIAALPTAPTGVLVNPGNNLNTINWTNGTGSTSSNIYRCLTVGGTYVKLTAGTNVTAVTFTDATVVNGTTYFYEVSNSNSGGEGPLSSPGVSGTPYLPGGSSSPPTGLTATYVAGVGIQLSWTNAAGNAYTGVNVYRLSGGSVNGIFQRIDPAVNQPLAVTTSFLDKPGLGFTSLTGSASHAYAVCGIVNNVETVLSNITSLVTFLG